MRCNTFITVNICHLTENKQTNKTFKKQTNKQKQTNKTKNKTVLVLNAPQTLFNV